VNVVFCNSKIDPIVLQNATAKNLADNANCFKQENITMTQSKTSSKGPTIKSTLNSLTFTQPEINNKVLFVRKDMASTINPNTPTEYTQNLLLVDESMVNVNQ